MDLPQLDPSHTPDDGADLKKLPRNPTRAVRVGSVTIGDGHPVAVQSMTATKTPDVDATYAQVRHLQEAGADVIRVAVDSKSDARGLEELARRLEANGTPANLSVDLQENYRLAEVVAPHVAKLRYNPGHLYHHERDKPWQEKVEYLAGVATEHDCAIRVGVNCGSVDPAKTEKYDPDDSISPMLESALDHCAFLDSIGFTRYVVSLKDSDPAKVIDVNRRFAQQRPDVPLHLGVTEAGMPPEGVIKTRVAFEQLIARGIGDTIRVSLTVPNDRKGEEIAAGRQILHDIEHGRVRSVVNFSTDGLNIISCPSCSRVENEAFVDLAAAVKEMTGYAKAHAVTIAVMGCRVNGPGETDDADLGLWCAPNFVNLKKGERHLGRYPYDEILPRLKSELDAVIAAKGGGVMARKKQVPAAEPYRVFLSHATYDKFLAEVVTERVEADALIRVFRDDRDIAGGENIPDAIRQAIRDSREMVVLLTPESLGREWVTLEIGMAQILGLRVVPLLYHVDPALLPATLKDTKAFELADLGDYLTQLSARAADASDD